MRPYKEQRPNKHLKTQTWYIKNRERIAEERKKGIRPDRREYNKQYRRENLQRLREYDRKRSRLASRVAMDKERHIKLQNIWSQGLKATENIWRQAEIMAYKILEEGGFSKIEHTNFYFPFDYWAMKDGLRSAIEVTCAYKRTKKNILKRFLAFTQWRYFVLFIRPNLQQFIIKEVPIDQSISRAVSSLKGVDKLRSLN